MNTDKTRKPSLDSILGAIRADEPSRNEIDAAAERVRAALGFDSGAVASSPVHIESCAGFQALIPDYLASRLPRATALLLEDHSRECIPCRRALIAARQPAALHEVVPARASRPAFAKWAVAASLAAIGVLAGYTAWRVLPGFGAAPDLRVMRVEGNLYQMTDGAPVPLRAGMVVPSSGVVRTAKHSSALLRLEDGSRVEMHDRTEFEVAARRNGATIRLRNGSIIVEAAPQGAGHLDVSTDDCLVSVKGTIFSVNHGTKGSRVSVVEGAVNVDAGGSERLLRPGDQTTTSESVDTVAVADEIAWSHDASRYAQLLGELASLRKDLDARVPNPKLRYGSALLDRLPEETVVYAAIPNLTEALLQARQVFMEHVAESALLQAWWDGNMNSPERKREMEEAFTRLRDLGTQLGDEIVVALALDPQGRIRGPMVSAQVKDLRAFRKALVNEARGMDIDATVSFDGSIVTIEPKKRGTAKAALSGADFHASPLRQRLAGSYVNGVSWLFGADLGALLDRAASDARAHGNGGARVATTWENMGLLDARYLIVERDESPDGATLRADLSFDGPRHGVAGWLADPAPMGALDFVSPDAAFAAAAVILRPELLLTEAISWIDPGDPDTLQHLKDFRAETGVDPLRDVAGSLGGDVAFAVDGPLLPVPSWKVAIEVYDPERLQVSIDKLAAWINDRLASEGRPERIEHASEVSGNRTDWVLRFTSPDAPDGGEAKVMRYTIVDGYFLAAPSRTLLDRAIEQRANGYTLTRSPSFTALLPRDGEVNVSALVWQNLGPSLGPIATRIARVIAPDDRASLDALAAESKPSLVTAYAENDRIIVGSRGEAKFGSMLGSIVSIGQLGAFQRAIGELHREAPGGRATP